MKESAVERRDFLKLALAGLAFLATGPQLIKSQFDRMKLGAPAKASRSASSDGQEESPHSWAMVIDQSKCVGCGQCTMACKAFNDIAPDIEWTRLVPAGRVGDKEAFIPIPCMHCDHPPCMHVCPVGATTKRPDGIVMMDYDRCIGCRYCEVACPYNARSFNWETFDGDNPAVPTFGQPEVERRPRGVVEKCTFCYQRIDRGLELGLKPGVDQAATPACVVACPTKARVFGDLNDPESPASKALAENASYRLREGLGTEPRVYYLPVHSEKIQEETTQEAA